MPPKRVMVYSIAPVDDWSKVRTVYHSLLKNCVWRVSSEVAPVEGLVELSGVSSQEKKEEVDLVGVICVGGRGVLSAVSETSVVPLPTSFPSSNET